MSRERNRDNNSSPRYQFERLGERLVLDASFLDADLVSIELPTELPTSAEVSYEDDRPLADVVTDGRIYPIPAVEIDVRPDAPGEAREADDGLSTLAGPASSPDAPYSAIGGGTYGPDYLTSVAQWLHQLESQIASLIQNHPSMGGLLGDPSAFGQWLSQGPFGSLPDWPTQSQSLWEWLTGGQTPPGESDPGSPPGWIGSGDGGAPGFGFGNIVWQWGDGPILSRAFGGEWEPRLFRLQLPPMAPLNPPVSPVGSISDVEPNHSHSASTDLPETQADEEIVDELALLDWTEAEEDAADERTLPAYFSNDNTSFWAGLLGDAVAEVHLDPEAEGKTDADVAADVTGRDKRQGGGSPAVAPTAFYDELVQQLILEDIPSNLLAESEVPATDAALEEMVNHGGLGMDYYTLTSFGLAAGISMVRQKRSKRKGSGSGGCDSQCTTQPATRGRDSAGTSRWIRLSTDFSSAQSGRTECLTAD